MCHRSTFRAENPYLWLCFLDRSLEFKWDLCLVPYVKQINDFFYGFALLMDLYTSLRSLRSCFIDEQNETVMYACLVARDVSVRNYTTLTVNGFADTSSNKTANY